MRSIMSLATGVLFSLSAFAQTDAYKNVYTESAWKERDTWQKPDEIVRKMNITKGSHVADIGCNEGYMTFRLANVVGENGRVYAVDVDQSKLDRMTKHKADLKLESIVVVKGDYDDPKLADNKLDAVIILDSYHEMDDHDKILVHIKDALKTGGRLVICEPIAKIRRDLARAEQEKKHELGMNFAIADLEKAGFKVLEKKDPFVDREKIKGDMMWIIVAVK